LLTCLFDDDDEHQSIYKRVVATGVRTSRAKRVVVVVVVAGLMRAMKMVWH
jgi:hypothetical protein